MSALALRERITEIKPELHHGVPVLRMHVGDPIPTPRAPERYAVLVNPDLARYLLTNNHPQNREKKPSAIAKYAADMAPGYWDFTPESIVFSSSGVLEDGQNRLWAVCEAGVSVWMMLDFGWPEGIIHKINRARSRTNGDAFKIDGRDNATLVPAAIAVVEKYDLTNGTPNRWTSRTLSSSVSLARYADEPEMWDRAAVVGRAVYASTKGLGPATWGAAYFVIARERGADEAQRFFDEVVAETGDPGSATRKLKSHYLRRKMSDTASGDSREPFENIVRAFNAWAQSKPVSFVRNGGAFALTQVRKS